MDSYLTTLEKMGISNNQALLLGQGTIRANTIGMRDRPLTDDELKAVTNTVEKGMDEGAFGLSTGLEYAPGLFTPTEEIVAMARVAARRGGIYATHIRNEETALLAAVNEAIQIGKVAGIRVQISHLKAAGRPNWPKQAAALQLIESARRSGIEVLADAYPYTAYSTGLTVFSTEVGTSSVCDSPTLPLDLGYEKKSSLRSPKIRATTTSSSSAVCERKKTGPSWG